VSHAADDRTPHAAATSRTLSLRNQTIRTHKPDCIAMHASVCAAPHLHRQVLSPVSDEKRTPHSHSSDRDGMDSSAADTSCRPHTRHGKDLMNTQHSTVKNADIRCNSLSW
jgi:hypothetical protein